MSTKILCLDDSYLKEFDSRVNSVKDGKYVVLDKTAFYPTGGGQPNDTGILIRKSDQKEFKVIFVGKFVSEISHEVDQDGLHEGDEIVGKIDWDRRYKLMRAHTSAHLVSTMVHNITDALITGNQLAEEKVRIDFSIDDYDPEIIKNCFEEVTKLINQNLDVKHYTISKEEAEKEPSLTKLAKGLPPGLKEIRIVEIGDFDKQADGGTHVKNTSEIGELEFIKSQNRGKSFRRIYYKLKSA